MGDVGPPRFTCDVCGQTHDLDALVAHEPEQWRLLTPGERTRSQLTPDQCLIESSEGESFYIRANLEIQICGTERVFTWGVWCSLSEKSFNEVCDHWDDPRRVELAPHFGWLSTPISAYPQTMYLKTYVHQRPPGVRPFVELEPTDHPLAIHQRNGIERAELQRIVTVLLHP